MMENVNNQRTYKKESVISASLVKWVQGDISIRKGAKGFRCFICRVHQDLRAVQLKAGVPVVYFCSSCRSSGVDKYFQLHWNVLWLSDEETQIAEIMEI